MKSENLESLKKIVAKLESKNFDVDSFDEDDKYRELSKQIDSMIHEELKNIELQPDNKSKIRCYESLFSSIILLLESIKQIA